MDLTREDCVDECPENQVEEDGKCECDFDNGAFFNSDRDGCVTNCQADEALNFMKTQCVDDCGENQMEDDGACVCQDSDDVVLNSDADGCQMLPCPDGQALNLN